MGNGDLQLNKYRFIDTQVMEDWKQPLFLLPISFKDAIHVAKAAKQKYGSWFSSRNPNSNTVSDFYSRNDKFYYLRWQERVTE